MKILDLLKEEGLLIETMFTISICTGLRRGEILGLHIDDIDFINNSISVKRAVVWDKEKQKIVEKDTKTKIVLEMSQYHYFAQKLLENILS